jgi:hypothetical protein
MSAAVPQIFAGNLLLPFFKTAPTPLHIVNGYIPDLRPCHARLLRGACA